MECCAWIDTAGAFDPASALEAGVDLDRILWVNCGGNAEHALKSTDLLIQAGGFGLVVLDLADTPDATARRISLASWFRLRHAAERAGAALVTVERQINARSCIRSARIENAAYEAALLWIGWTTGELSRRRRKAAKHCAKSAPRGIHRIPVVVMFACLNAPGNLPWRLNAHAA